jgi:hypothetical protein
MQRNKFSITKWGLIVAVVVMTLPVTTFAQRSWIVVRPRRQRVVVYQPQPSVIYQRSYTNPYTYNYTQPYYGTSYNTYGYSQPYYGSTYSYQYSQPYYANRYAYSSVSPTYGYTYREYRPRYRRNRVRFGVYIR